MKNINPAAKKDYYFFPSWFCKLNLHSKTMLIVWFLHRDHLNIGATKIVKDYKLLSFYPGFPELCANAKSVQRRKWSPDRKWSPNWTANDPEPQMIPDVNRKWCRRKTTSGMDFAFLDFFLNWWCLFFACVTLVTGLELTQFKRLRGRTCYQNTLEVSQQR